MRGDDDIARLGTSFNQMAASLQKQIRQLEELSRVQRRFVSDVSHELRTPLTTVRMAGDVLHDARDALRPVHRPRRRAAAERARPVRAAARRPARDQPVRRGRRGARPRGRQPRRPRAPGRGVDPGRSPSARGTTVVVRAGSRPCVAEVDPRRVERIVRNLVTNAIDYADSRRRRGARRRRRRGHRARRARPRRRAATRRGGDGVQPLLAGRPGARPHHRRHRSRAVDLAGGRAPARRLAAGVGRARRGVRSSGSPCRAAPATRCPARARLPLVPRPMPASAPSDGAAGTTARTVPSTSRRAGHP